MKLHSNDKVLRFLNIYVMWVKWLIIEHYLLVQMN